MDGSIFVWAEDGGVRLTLAYPCIYHASCWLSYAGPKPASRPRHVCSTFSPWLGINAPFGTCLWLRKAALCSPPRLTRRSESGGRLTVRCAQQNYAPMQPCQPPWPSPTFPPFRFLDRCSWHPNICHRSYQAQFSEPHSHCAVHECDPRSHARRVLHLLWPVQRGGHLRLVHQVPGRQPRVEEQCVHC